MVLFEWERKSMKPVQATEANQAAWRRYDHLRTRFWEHLLRRSISQNKNMMQVLKAKHTKLELHHGGYPSKSLHDTIDQVHIESVESSLTHRVKLF
jgi:hypothetical protein